MATPREYRGPAREITPDAMSTYLRRGCKVRVVARFGEQVIIVTGTPPNETRRSYRPPRGTLFAEVKCPPNATDPF